MESSVRSGLGNALQTYLLTGQPFQLVPSTTLNEKFGIQSGVLPPNGITPTMKYFAIGIGGHQLTVGADNIPIPQPVQHSPEDCALFRHLPFVLRLVTNDLATGDRAKYAMRREETWNGTRYVAYYLKRIDFTGVTVDMDIQVVNGDTTTSTPWVPNADNLNPTPQQLANQGVNTTDGSFLVASADLTLPFTEDDLTELTNAVEIIYGSDLYAIVSEIALVSGVDQIVSVTSSSLGTFNFNEAICAQCLSYINALYSVKFISNAISVDLSVGATEPLLILGSGSTPTPTPTPTP